MKLATEELDRRIIAVLKGGEQILSDLAVNTGCDAREILKRLHVLAGSKQVQCSKHDGSLFWALGEAEGGSPKKELPARELRPAPAEAPQAEGDTSSPSAAQSDAVPPPARGRRTRAPLGYDQPIVVRPAVQVLELRVVRLAEDRVLIEEVQGDPNCLNDGVAVCKSDLPALIAALTAIHEEAAA